MATTRTNLGPLTTQFKYPDECTAAVLSCPTCETAWQAQTCGDNEFNDQGVSDNVDCWPPRTKATEAGPINGGWGFYSPGFECPDRYEPACSATGTETSNFNFQFIIEDGETVIGCCPTGYSCVDNGGQQTCTTVASTGVIQALSCSTRRTVLDWLTLPHTVTVTETGTASGEDAVLESVTIYAPMFQLNHRASDLPSSATTNTSTEPPDESTAAVDPTSGLPTPESSGGGGLSTGAQAGIGVGVGIVGLAIIGAAIYLWRRRKSSAASKPEPSDQESKAVVPELPGSQSHPVELDAGHRAELA